MNYLCTDTKIDDILNSMIKNYHILDGKVRWLDWKYCNKKLQYLECLICDQQIITMKEYRKLMDGQYYALIDQHLLMHINKKLIGFI